MKYLVIFNWLQFLKLMEVREQLAREDQFNLMRVGQEGSVHPAVREFLFEKLLDKNTKT
jgi:hypothetical protein